jgi:nucleoid DNA-binding protein
MSEKNDGSSFRSHLIETLITRAGEQGLMLSRPDAMKIVGSFFDIVTSSLEKGQSVEVSNLGTFEVVGEAGSKRISLSGCRSLLSALESE